MNQLVLKRLALTNFKSFVGSHSLALDTDPGLFYVTGENCENPDLGPNGIGKSTLWDALSWVLWNTTIRDARPAAAILPWGLESGQTKVSLTFNRHGDEHCIIRTRRPNSLTLDGRNIEQGEIPRLLGMGEDIFRRTVILGQFGSLFLDLAPEAQSRMFNEALDLNLWLRASDHASQTEKRARAELTEIERRKADLTGRETEAGDALFRALESERNFIAERVRKVKAAEAALANRRDELTAIKAKAPPNPRGTAQMREHANSAMTAGDSELTRQRAAVREIEGELARLEAERRTEDAAAKRARVVINGYKDAQKTRTCPECGQKVTQAHLKEKLQVLVLELAEHEVLVARLDKRVAKAWATLDDKNTSLQMLETQQRAAQDADMKYYAAQNAWQLKVAQAESSVREAQAQVKILNGQVNVFTAEVERLRAHLEKLKATLAKLAVDHTALEHQAESAKFWVGAFKEIRLSLVDDALAELEIATNRHAEALGLTDWRIAFTTERETQSGNTSYKFSVWLYPPEAEEPVKFESYSGGESQRWQLAVAFGLEEVLLSRAGVICNVLAIDEPSKGLSEQGVDMLLGHLKQKARDHGQAIFYTDHHSLNKGDFDATLFITKDARGSSLKWL